MESEWYAPLLEYYKLTSMIYMTRHMGGNYKKHAKMAREILDELRRLRPPPPHHIPRLEHKLRWALEAPPGVSSDDYGRGGA